MQRLRSIVKRHWLATLVTVAIAVWVFGMNLAFQKGLLDFVPNWAVFLLLAIPALILIIAGLAHPETRKHYYLLHVHKIVSLVLSICFVAVVGGIIWLLFFITHPTSGPPIERAVPKTDGKLDQISAQLADLQARFGDGLDPQKLLAKYPLGYVIFEINYSSQVFPYDNKLTDRYKIDWRGVGITKNTPDEIELRLPGISLKDGTGGISNVITGGNKKVGDLGGGAVGDLAVFGEILEIKANGVVFLVGFQKDRTGESMKDIQISEKAVARFHMLYNSGRFTDIWNESDLQFRTNKFTSSTRTYSYLDFMGFLKDRTGEFLITTNTISNCSFTNGLAIVKITQKSTFQKVEAEEKFAIIVRGDSASLRGYGLGVFDAKQEDSSKGVPP